MHICATTHSIQHTCCSARFCNSSEIVLGARSRKTTSQPSPRTPPPTPTEEGGGWTQSQMHKEHIRRSGRFAEIHMRGGPSFRRLDSSWHGDCGRHMFYLKKFQALYVVVTSRPWWWFIEAQSVCLVHNTHIWEVDSPLMQRQRSIQPEIQIE